MSSLWHTPESTRPHTSRQFLNGECRPPARLLEKWRRLWRRDFILCNSNSTSRSIHSAQTTQQIKRDHDIVIKQVEYNSGSNRARKFQNKADLKLRAESKLIVSNFGITHKIDVQIVLVSSYKLDTWNCTHVIMHNSLTNKGAENQSR